MVAAAHERRRSRSQALPRPTPLSTFHHRSHMRPTVATAAGPVEFVVGYGMEILHCGAREVCSIHSSDRPLQSLSQRNISKHPYQHTNRCFSTPPLELRRSTPPGPTTHIGTLYTVRYRYSSTYAQYMIVNANRGQRRERGVRLSPRLSHDPQSPRVHP